MSSETNTWVVGRHSYDGGLEEGFSMEFRPVLSSRKNNSPWSAYENLVNIGFLIFELWDNSNVSFVAYISHFGTSNAELIN